MSTLLIAPPRPPVVGQETVAVRLLLLEAEAFDDLGGWVLDQQFADLMALLPPRPRRGRPWPTPLARSRSSTRGRTASARTRDWVAPWGVEGAGRFQVLVDGEPLQVTFGTEGEPWHWQDGGVVRRTRATVSLHDPTGFEGRCDAVLLTPTSTSSRPTADLLEAPGRRARAPRRARGRRPLRPRRGRRRHRGDGGGCDGGPTGDARGVCPGPARPRWELQLGGARLARGHVNQSPIRASVTS